MFNALLKAFSSDIAITVLALLVMGIVSLGWAVVWLYRDRKALEAEKTSLAERLGAKIDQVNEKRVQELKEHAAELHTILDEAVRSAGSTSKAMDHLADLVKAAAAASSSAREKVDQLALIIGREGKT